MANEFLGSCHCGNIGLRVTLTQAPETMQVRADQCGFCRRHNAHTASDPGGLFGISARDASRVVRYRFGLRTADFIVCRDCGVYVGAICETPAGLRGVVNVNTLDQRARFRAVAEPVNYDGETVESRLARRSARWMPAVTTF